LYINIKTLPKNKAPTTCLQPLPPSYKAFFSRFFSKSAINIINLFPPSSTYWQF